MQRMGFVIGINPDDIAEYKRIHANGWPEVNAMIKKCNIANYSIYLREPENLLFGYYEYHGTDHDVDMAKMAEDAKTREWWAICEPMQRPLDTRAEGDWWASTEEVFHLD